MSSQGLKVLFAGTPDFAAETLKAILASHHQVCAVYTQPDRPAGRGRKLTPSAVKCVALEHDLPVYQPQTLRDESAQAELAALEPDVMVVVAYGLILPQAVLDIPKQGCLNVHASLLPRWRGAAPIQRAIQSGDAESGVTIMQMDAGLDTGDMLLKVHCDIAPGDTAQVLHDRLAEMGAQAIIEVLDQIVAGDLSPEKQDDELATYAAKMDKQEASIDWSQPAQQIARMVWAFNPWPVAFSQLNDKMFRILDCEVVDRAVEEAPGTVIAEGEEGIDVATGEGVLRLKQVQLAGKKATAANEFVRGRSLQGVVLGQ